MRCAVHFHLTWQNPKRPHYSHANNSIRHYQSLYPSLVRLHRGQHLWRGSLSHAPSVCCGILPVRYRLLLRAAQRHTDLFLPVISSTPQHILRKIFSILRCKREIFRKNQTSGTLRALPPRGQMLLIVVGSLLFLLTPLLLRVQGLPFSLASTTAPSHTEYASHISIQQRYPKQK